MKVIEVKYNGVEITPTPLVSRTYQFVDYGGRFGQTEAIELSCYVTGIDGNYIDSVNQLNALFATQFKTLEVNEVGTAGNIYKWDYVVLQEVEIPQNHFFIGSFTPYKAKFLSYQIPSGVLDPTNEYAFSQSEDGIVTVNHHISARGVRDINSPIDNAIGFVNAFVRKNPYTSCAPIFIPNSSGILFSISETTDRITSTYAVTETYKYVTGQPNVGYLTTNNVAINDSNSNDFINIDLTVTIQGSPVDKNHSEVQSAIQSIDPATILQTYGISSTNVYREGFTLNYESGTVKAEIKASFISGVDSDLSGYFDYGISMDQDSVTKITNWKIDGEYITRGPLNIRKTKLNSFKTSNQDGGYLPYLKNILENAPLYTEYGGAYPLNIIQINVNEDTGRATFKLSASFSDYDNYALYIQPKYSVDVEPSRWIYEMLPAANIEGHYIVQDLQMTNRARVRLSFNATTTGESTGNYSYGSAMLARLSDLYLATGGFVLSEVVNSGISNISIEQENMGGDKMATGVLTTKVQGGYNNNYVRRPGFRFGY